jgi:hypothetical protein
MSARIKIESGDRTTKVRFYILILMLVGITFSLGLFAQDSEDLVSKKFDGNLSSVSGENSSDKKILQDSEQLIESNTNLTQAQIRQSRKLEISLGSGVGFENTLKIQYNISPSFSIGYSHFHRKEISNIQTPYLSSIGSAYNDSYNSSELGLLNVKYFLFEKFPFYVTAGLGRDFLGKSSKDYLLLNPKDSGDYRYMKFESHSDPQNCYFLGFGLQWIFKNGFLMGFEFLNLKGLARKTHYNTSGLGFQPNEGNMFYLISHYPQLESASVISRLPNLWIGYSFPL